MQSDKFEKPFHGANTPVFMVGIDGADWRLVQRMLAAGKLPVLSRSMRGGCFGRLESPANEYAGGVWPDFYTGKSVAQHGIYHNKLWRQEHMRCEVPTDGWLSSRPFYEALSAQGYRVCMLDMPMVLDSPRSLNGVYLGGWGTHDLIAKGASPAGLWQQLEARHGAPIMPAESTGRQSAPDLLLLRDQLIAATKQMTQIGIELLAAEPWDFSGIVLGAPHRAGHYLWDDSQLEQASPSDRQRIATALEDVYIACDNALEQLLAVAPDAALKIVFAVHGMTLNHGWGDLGADILEGLLQHAMGQKPRRGLLYEIRRRVPMHMARPLLSRLPQAVTGKLVELWSSNMYHWDTTPYFPVPMDQAGYIRINLKGREKNGIVEPGAEYEQLCDELEHQFMGLYDADSGRRIVGKVVRAWLEAPDSAQARDLLPDLVVVWGERSTRHCRRIASRQFPEFTLEVPPRIPSGRSGNHVGDGWFVAQGQNLITAGEVCGYSIRDFAPSVFNTLGATPLQDFESQVLMW